MRRFKFSWQETKPSDNLQKEKREREGERGREREGGERE